MQPLAKQAEFARTRGDPTLCQTRLIAVFDVDETLIAVKSMFAFLRFFLMARYGAEEGLVEYGRERERLERLRRMNTREQVNREFYRVFRNQALSDLQQIAESWFDDEISTRPDFFIPETCALLEHYRQNDAIIVFLSGSADFILQPIVRHLGGGEVLAVQLDAVDGVATGELEGIQTIGQGKRDALDAFLARNRLSMARSVAVGDHISDLPFLEMAADPMVIAGDRDLEMVAHARGWKIMETAHSI
jgi:HAD superfamily hydrolase (TIGR01490 family)